MEAGGGFAARMTGGAVGGAGAAFLAFLDGLEGVGAGGACCDFASDPFFAAGVVFCASAAFFLAFLPSGAGTSAAFDIWFATGGGGGGGAFFFSSFRLGLVTMAAIFAWSL